LPMEIGVLVWTEYKNVPKVSGSHDVAESYNKYLII